MELLAERTSAGRAFGEGVIGDGLHGLEAVVAVGTDVGVGWHADSFGKPHGRDGSDPRDRWHSRCASAKSTPYRDRPVASRPRELTSSLLPVIASDLRIAGAVALGGVGGAGARWAVTLGIPWNPPAFPWATMMVNLLGCVAIGLLLTLWTEGSPPAWWVRPMVAVGFVGGFTTFSALAVEGVRLVEAGAPGVALSYVVASVVVGLLIVRASALAMRRSLFTNRGGA
jgi:CrcB protein